MVERKRHFQGLFDLFKSPRAPKSSCYPPALPARVTRPRVRERARERNHREGDAQGALRIARAGEEGELNMRTQAKEQANETGV